MKPFDLEAAKAGAKVQTTRGYPVTILMFDKKGLYPIVALVQEKPDEESVRTYLLNGKEYVRNTGIDDLVMAPVVKYKVTLEQEFASLAEAQYYCAQFKHLPQITKVEE